jgi:methyl-accepting chemotaxis protein
MAEDLSIAILREIRDAVRANGARIDQTNERIDQTNQRLDQTNERLDQTNESLDQTNERVQRLEGAMLELAEQQRFLVRLAKTGQGRDRRLEQEVLVLRGRVDDIEARLDEG